MNELRNGGRKQDERYTTIIDPEWRSDAMRLL
jgi:hypothetical protein